ncbi:MAG: DUF2269 family protein [Actinomycetota bacterium]
MRNALLIGHIATAMLFIGPATFAASAFPRQAAAAADGDTAALGAARILHRVSRGYGRASLIVGAAGLALAQQGSWWNQAWIWISLVIYAAASAVLILVVIPTQASLLSNAESNGPIDPAAKGRLHTVTGLYSIAWMIVLTLMIIKP